MKKKVCELCGQYMSDDMLFGVALCNRCREIYSDVKQVLSVTEDREFMQNATPQAKNLFEEKLKRYDVSTLKMQLEAERQQRLQYEAECRKAEMIHQEQQRKLYDEQQERFKEVQERFQQETEDREAFLKANGHQGYYEYRILNTSEADIAWIADQLNSLGRQGWQLCCTHNISHAEKNILILERFIKFKE